MEKGDAGIDVQSKIILWSWTFSCDVGDKDLDSCPGATQRLGIHHPKFLFSSVKSSLFRRKWQIKESASDQPLIFPPVTGYRK